MRVAGSALAAFRRRRGARRASAGRRAASCWSPGIEGGGFIAVPERCRFSLIRKLLPGEDLDAAAARSRRSCAARSPTPRSTSSSPIPPAATMRSAARRPRSMRDRPEVAHAAAAMAEAMAGRGADRGRALLVGIAVLRQPPRHSRRLFRAGRHPHLPHPRGARRARGVSSPASSASPSFMARYCGVAE